MRTLGDHKVGFAYFETHRFGQVGGCLWADVAKLIVAMGLVVALAQTESSCLECGQLACGAWN